MTITLRKSADRVRVFEGNGRRWATPVEDFRALQSLVEHDVAPGMGFLLHAHHEQEILTYVQDGAVIQGDSAGRTGGLRAGEFRRTSCAAGSTHTSINQSRTERAHVFQSGIVTLPLPLRPGGEQKLFPFAERKGILRLVASPDGREGSLRTHQDVRLYSSVLHLGTHLIHEFEAGRRGWLHVVAGRVQLGESLLDGGDGAGFIDEVAVSFTATEPSEILLFDLP